MFKNLMIVAALLTLTACANMPGGSGGEDRMSREYIQANLTVGKSTKADVQALYGQPRYKAEDSGGEDYWSYSEDQINPDYVSKALDLLPSFAGRGYGAGGAAADTQRRQTSRDIAFNFDSRGVLRSYSISGSTGAR